MHIQYFNAGICKIFPIHSNIQMKAILMYVLLLIIFNMLCKLPLIISITKMSILKILYIIYLLCLIHLHEKKKVFLFFKFGIPLICDLLLHLKL